MEQVTEDVSFEQMQGTLGSLLLLWSRIERAARDEVASAHDGQLPKSAYGISGVLNAWKAAVADAQNTSPLRKSLAIALRSQLQHPLDIRNGICHGLVGLSATYDDQPATLTWELNDEARSITWQELQVDFKWLSKVPRAIWRISNHSGEKPGSRLIDSPENRNLWNSEYGIDVAGAI